ncbi:MAG: hypothetical protein II010_05650 [Oscillospiraceae bacterium]|nr:hypothetical protein [Oscillospiraceae bacterium]
MTKEDIIRKLTSRKFWVALVAFITALLTAFQFPENVITQVASVIMGLGALISYIWSEGWVDAKRAGAQSNDQQSEP